MIVEDFGPYAAKILRDHGNRSGARVLQALVPPVLAQLVVMEPAKHVRVVIEPVGRAFHLVKVMAVIASGCLLLGPLTHDVQFFPAQLNDPG
jgi:hypothetical protein